MPVVLRSGDSSKALVKAALSGDASFVQSTPQDDEVVVRPTCGAGATCRFTLTPQFG